MGAQMYAQARSIYHQVRAERTTHNVASTEVHGTNWVSRGRGGGRVRSGEEGVEQSRDGQVSWLLGDRLGR